VFQENEIRPPDTASRQKLDGLFGILAKAFESQVQGNFILLSQVYSKGPHLKQRPSGAFFDTHDMIVVRMRMGKAVCTDCQGAFSVALRIRLGTPTST
jgi:hypothetical protein